MKPRLAIEASTSLCSVALAINGKIIQRSSDEPRAHTQFLMQFIDELLQEQQLAVGDLEAIVFGAGPGSFTGVRLAASVAKSLAYAARIPVVGVSSLAVLAQSYYQQNSDAQGDCLVLVDARMGEYYVGHYQRTPQGQVVALKQDALLKPEELQQFAVRAEMYITDGSEFSAKAVPEQQSWQAIQAEAEYLFALAEHAEIDKNSALTEQVNYLRGKSGWKNLSQQKQNL